MQVELHDGQLQVVKDTHRFKIICAGRRWGKSVVGRLVALKWCLDKPNALVWIVSPTYRQGKQNHWLNLKREIPKQWIAKLNEVELSITLRNGSIIQLKGAENPDALRGQKLNGLVIDEIASIRNWNWLWQEVLRPTLTDYEAPAIFISTPKGFNHFYQLFLQGQETDAIYKSWRFTSYDNPFIPKGDLDAARDDLFEDTFAQEYLADFRKATGLAHKQWDRAIHVIEPFAVPKHWQRARGFDYGSANPTASVRVAIDGEGNWFVEKCYKNSSLAIEEHAKVIRAQDYGLGFIPIWGDPSGLQWVKEFSKHQVYIEPANKVMNQNARGWVEHCIERVNDLLKPIPGHTVQIPGQDSRLDAPKLFVLNTEDNQWLIKEFELLSWQTTSGGSTIPILDEENDPYPQGHFDLLAALRYLAVSFAPMPKTQGGVPFDAEHRQFGVSTMDAYR